MSTEIAIITKSGLDLSTQQMINEAFAPFLEQAKEWKEKAETLVVTDIAQVKEMKDAREARLALKNLRVAADKKRKQLKEDSIRYGNTVQAVYNLIESSISPIEKHLEDQERFKEREELRLKGIRYGKRMEEIEPLLSFIPAVMIQQLADLDDQGYNDLLKYGQDQKRRLEEEAEAKRLAEEKVKLAEAKKDARYKILFDLGLKFDGEQFLRKDINVHWTDIVTADDKEFDAIVSQCSSRLHEILAQEAQELAAKEEREKAERERSELQAARLKILMPMASHVGSLDMTALWDMDEPTFNGVLQIVTERHELAVKQAAIEKAQRDERLRQLEEIEQKKRDEEAKKQAELSKGDQGKMNLLIADLDELRGRYKFESERYQELSQRVGELIGKIVTYVVANSKLKS